MDKREGGVSRIPLKIFCLTVRKNALGEPFCAVFQKISGSQKFIDKRGGSIESFRRSF